MVFAEQHELFPVVRTPACLRHDIGTCLGPCAALCTRAEYQGGVDAARAFLEGTDLSALAALEGEMQSAAAAALFERAAALRGKLGVSTWLARCLGRRRGARGHAFRYGRRGHQGGALWYAVREGRIVAVRPAPAAGEEGRALAELVAQLPPPVPGPPGLEE